MTKYLNLNEQRSGTRRLYLGIVVVIALIVVAAAAWSLLSPGPKHVPTGSRSDQPSGASSVAKQTAPPPSAAPNSTTPETVGRNEQIEATGSEQSNFNAGQRKAINEFVTQHAPQKMNHANFTIAVGAAVPRSISLSDIPTTLSDKLSAYSGDQYFIVSNQFVVVEKATRRIVAIITVAV